ncbi:MAG TPA: dienelactone hydrolase family protein [Chitinophagaceae bacterium]|nr:dienelactone hydrolase family protein [Chitinophagaceae bacterium]
MKLKAFHYAGALALCMTGMSCNNNETKPAEEKPVAEAKAPSIKSESVSYGNASIALSGFVAYDENSDTRRPAVLVVPEWWGMTDFPKKMAIEVAKLGFVAFTVDMYGSGKVADNPDTAGKWAMPFYTNPQLAKSRFDAALAKLKTYAQVDTTKIAAIGYCFGGGMVLNMARLGEDLKGVVSFHGNLVGVPVDKNKLKAQMLICQGGADQFVKPAEVEKFKKDMDNAGIQYTFKTYEGAMHAFTNPDATALGKKFSLPIAYNAAADSSSWAEMKTFFNKVLR